MFESFYRSAAACLVALTLAWGCQAPEAPASGSSPDTPATTPAAATVKVQPIVLTNTLTTKPQTGEVLGLTLRGPEAFSLTWDISPDDPYASPESDQYNRSSRLTLPTGTYTYKVTLTTDQGQVRVSAEGTVEVTRSTWKIEVRLGPPAEPVFDAPRTVWTLATSLATHQVRFDWWLDADGEWLFGTDSQTAAEDLRYNLTYNVYDPQGVRKNFSPLSLFNGLRPSEIRDLGRALFITAGSNTGYTFDQGYRLEFNLEMYDPDNNYVTFTKSVTMAPDTSGPVARLSGSFFWEPARVLGQNSTTEDWLGFPLPSDNFDSADKMTYGLMLYDGTAAAPSEAQVLTDSRTTSIPMVLKQGTRASGSTLWLAEVSAHRLPASASRWAFVFADDRDGNRTVIAKFPTLIQFGSGRQGTIIR